MQIRLEIHEGTSLASDINNQHGGRYGTKLISDGKTR